MLKKTVDPLTSNGAKLSYLFFIRKTSADYTLLERWGQFESLAARSKFIVRSKSPFGRSADQKLLKQVTLTLSEVSHGSDPGDETSGPNHKPGCPFRS
jgi:hypothetical protein